MNDPNEAEQGVSLERLRELILTDNFPHKYSRKSLKSYRREIYKKMGQLGIHQQASHNQNRYQNYLNVINEELTRRSNIISIWASIILSLVAISIALSGSIIDWISDKEWQKSQLQLLEKIHQELSTRPSVHSPNL